MAASLPRCAPDELRPQRAIYALAALRTGVEAVEVVHLFLERAHDPATRTFERDRPGALEQQAAGLARRGC